MADEVSEAYNISYDLLHADALLAAIVGAQIYQEAVPPGSFGPYVLGSFVPGDRDFLGVGGQRLMAFATIRWRVIRKGQLNTAMRSADVRMDTVLHAVRAQLSGGYTFSIVRDRPHRSTYYDDANNIWTEVGGLYNYFIGRA